jgi:hypothetical protein
MCQLIFVLVKLDRSNGHEFIFDIHESLHRDMIMKVTNKMQLCRLIYYSWLDLHVLGDVFAHHQEHLTVFTASGSIHPSCWQLAATWVNLYNCILLVTFIIMNSFLYTC